MHHSNNFIQNLLLIVLISICWNSIGQELEEQVSFGAIEKIIASPDGKYYVVRNLDRYTLIEQKTKIQVGSMTVDIGSAGGKGLGKIEFLDNTRFIVNTVDDLQLVDILNKKVEQLFDKAVFPEMVENFIVLPDSKVLVTTKIYPLKKGETIHFDDTSANCRLYLFDAASRTVVRSVDISHSVTALSIQGNSKKVLAGTFGGSVLEIASDLEYRVLFKPTNKPIFYIGKHEELYIVVPHREKFITTSGDGAISLYDDALSLVKTIELPIEEPADKRENVSGGIRATASNQIWNLLVPKNEPSILVNYGFSRLMKINLRTNEKENLDVPYASAYYYCFNKSESQLLTGISSSTGIWASADSLKVYDLHNRKIISSFPSFKKKVTYRNLYKKHASNYFYAANVNSNGDSLVFYGSNQSVPIFFKGNGSTFLLNSSTNHLAVKTGGQIIFGDLNLDALKNRDYSFYVKTNKYSAATDTLHNDIFAPLFDTRNFAKDILPFGVLAIAPLENDRYVIAGYDYVKKEMFNSYFVIDAAGTVYFTLKNYTKYSSTLHFQEFKVSPSGKYFVIAKEKGDGAIIEVWDWKSNKIVYAQNYKSQFDELYNFDKTKDVFWYGTFDENRFTSLFSVDLNGATLVAQKRKSKLPYYEFLPDEQNDLLAMLGDRLVITKLSSEQELWSVPNKAIGTAIHPHEDGFGFSDDNSYTTINNKMLSTFFTTYVGYKPVEIASDLYYRADKSIINNLAFVMNGSGFLPSDYDLYFNRPDKVILQSGSKNQQYNDQLTQAVEKRLAKYPKVDFNELVSSAPQIEITNADQIKDLTKKDTEIIKFKISSTNGNSLQSYKAWVNGIPLWGDSGQSISGNVNKFETELSVKLSAGLNTIQLSGTDEKNFKSNTETVRVYADYTAEPKVYLVLLAADKYDDPNFNLKYSVKDAKDIAALFEKKYGNRLMVDSLFNSNITRNNISKIKSRIASASVNDKIILYVSGHGVLDKKLSFRFATPDMVFAKPDSYGILGSELEDILINCPARHRLLMIDACHSGELDREAYNANDLLAETSSTIEGSKGSIGSNSASLDITFELMKELFADVSKKGGIKVISAAAGDSYALEGDKWNNGVFTHSLLSILEKHDKISITDLRKEVTDKVKKLTDGRQQPTNRGDDIEFDFNL